MILKIQLQQTPYGSPIDMHWIVFSYLMGFVARVYSSWWSFSDRLTFTPPVPSALLFIMALKEAKRLLRDSMKSLSPLFSYSLRETHTSTRIQQMIISSTSSEETDWRACVCYANAWHQTGRSRSTRAENNVANSTRAENNVANSARAPVHLFALNSGPWSQSDQIDELLCNLLWRAESRRDALGISAAPNKHPENSCFHAFIKRSTARLGWCD